VKSWILRNALLAGCTLSIACGAETGPDVAIEDPEAPSAPEADPTGPVGVTTVPVQNDLKIGSGTIKSYVQETELEPPFLSGSLFANGFTLTPTGGMGGAGSQIEITNAVAQLGLGSGTLTTLLLFDRSISMSDPWEGEPRWQVAGRAFMAGMIGYESQVTLGTIFFPQANECEVAPLSDPRQIQFQSGTLFKQDWEAFPQNRFPSGGTPLGAAFEEANRVIDDVEPYGLLPPGRRFRVAIVTDGKPNCGTDEQRVLFLAGRWASRGIEITVIGLPGSEEASAFLNQLSAYGGSTTYLAPQDEDEASDSFRAVVK
jgi:hypothetical protein